LDPETIVEFVGKRAEGAFRGTGLKARSLASFQTESWLTFSLPFARYSAILSLEVYWAGHE